MKYFLTFLKDCSENDYEVAHLFEHLIVNRIILAIKMSGYQFGYGRVGGETFEDGPVSIQLNLYEKGLYELSRDILLDTQKDSFTTSEIKKAIRQLEAEEISRAVYKLSDIKKELLVISDLPWREKKKFKKPEPVPRHDATKKWLIEFIRDPNSFYNINFWLRLGEKSYKNDISGAVIFFLMHNLFIEFINDLLSSRLDGYPVGDDPIKKTGQGFLAQFTIRVSRDITNEDMEKELSHLRILKGGAGYNKIKKSLALYFSNPLYKQTINKDISSQLGIKVGEKSIEDILTEESYNNFLKNLELGWDIETIH